MAHLENPYNLDDDDDAVFSALLSQGLVYIVDDDDELDSSDDYDIVTDEVLREITSFLDDSKEGWVNLSHLSTYLYETYGKNVPKRLVQPIKKYSSLLKFIADYPSLFELQKDSTKTGLYWVRVKRTQ